ncbi:MAG: hypothetical protein ACI8XM_000256 [Haloarculaceae archaeon]|jgi:hypothetical protein
MSGSRLPGDSESADRHVDVDERAESRLSGDLAYRFGEYIDAHGKAKSDVVRAALDEYLPASENSVYVLPRDTGLADAYLALAGDTKRVLDIEQAIDILTQESHPNTPKSLIKDDVLKPLDAGGLVGVKGGRVAIHPLTLREEVADAE